MNFFIKYELIIVCFALFSCNSDNKLRNGHTTQDKDTTNVLSVYNAGAERKVQIFEINTSIQQTINGKQGTIVTFPAQCFGKVQGIVKIELIECYSIQEMILNGLSTQTTDGKLLESDGMIYLNALNEKGDTLEIMQGKVKVQMPTKQEKNGIRYFKGIEKGNNITWNLSNEKLKVKENSNVKEQQDTYGIKVDNIPCCEDSLFEPKILRSQIIVDKKIKSGNLVNYIFMISKMGWQNCDRFIEGETKPLIVNVPKESTGASYYLVLKNYNSSSLPKQTTDGKLSFIIPINEPYTIVALSSKGEDIYFNMMDYTGEKSEVDFSGLKPVTRQELTDLLMRKFGKDIWNRPSA
jgi:hypothetical protein